MAMATLNQSSPALTASMDMPITQNTAPVLEFRCLYTSDLRRKQKRWQDGRLKFHTFNKRVMVYDERSNFVGDTHWRKDYQFDEGEELELERGGIMVEVGECIGKRNQDLTELVDKRVKEREERVAAKHAASPMRPPASLNPQTPAGSALLGPKSLNAVLGNSTGHYGKAVIPNLSPFEQRQQANRDENENEPPAKRQRQDNMPPSKNGYAQSLMGTKLTLASSRPPSTASIRYEPFRPSFQRTPAATIDLTGEEDDRTVPEKVRPNANTDTRTGNKSQRQRPHKSPPARSGYASNLIGASLSLNKPESFAPKRSGIGLGLSTKGIRQAQETGSSSSLESDTLREDGAAEERPTKRIQKQKEPINKRTKPVLDPPTLPRSSSPPVMSQPTSLSKSTTFPNKATVTQGSSVSRPTDQPVSTLRIKSRAPRKMMMLMDRPTPRSLAPIESSDDAQPASRTLRPSKLAPQEVVLSQATMLLDAFRERQEQRLQDRLNCKRPNVDSDDLSSSPADVGIDHRMIDSLLSRKTKQPKRVVAEAPAEAHQQTSSVNPERGSEDEEVVQVRKPSQPRTSVDADVNSNAIAFTSSNSSSQDSHNSDHASIATQKLHQQTPSIPELLPRSTIPSSDAISNMAPSPAEAQKARPPQANGSPKSLLQSTIPSSDATTDMGASPSDILVAEKRAEGNVKTRPVYDSISKVTSPPAPVNQPEQDLESNELENMASKQGPGFTQLAKDLSKVGSSPTVYKITSPKSQPIANAIVAAGRIDPSMNASNAAVNPEVERTAPVSERQERIPTNLPSARTRGPSLPAHFSSAMMSATEHFRSIIKCSTSPSNPTVSEQPPDLEPPVLPPAPVLEVRKEESMSGEVVIKASPKPSPPLAEGLSSEAPRDEAAESTKGTENTSGPTIPPVPSARTIQPKAKLVNPATRGPSVQMTANRTVNALVPALNGLPSMPPPPRSLIRPGRTLAQTESVESRMKEPVKEVTPGGPWSRESFDLFGTWRPPGRDKGTSSVNG